MAVFPESLEKRWSFGPNDSLTAHRRLALSENLRDPSFASTFDCIACTLLTSDLEPAYYGPFPADDTFPAYP